MSVVWMQTEEPSEFFVKWERLRTADRQNRQLRKVLAGQSLVIAALIYALYWSVK